MDQGKPDNEDLCEAKKVQTFDTLHDDEALRVIANYQENETWSTVEEKHLLRKIDYQLMPILFFTYALQYHDKAMLSQAALFGLREDLKLNVGNRYTFASSIFYVGFICGTYPAILLSQRFPLQRVVAITTLLWGACLMATAGCTTWQGLWAERFFLGFLEAGIPPIFMLVVGSWYTKREQALRMGIWFCSTGYTTIVSPLLNYGLGHITGGSLSPWQYMYLVAGAIPVLWALVIYLYLPTDPIKAKGFSDRERYIAVARLRKNNTGIRNTHFKAAQAVECMLDPLFWSLFFMAALLMIANGPASTFIPIIVSGFGYSPLNSLLLVMPAGAVIGTVQLCACYAALRLHNTRTWIIVICQLTTVLACLLLWQLPRNEKGGLLFAVYILSSFGGSYAVVMGLAVANTAGYTKRSISSAGLFLGSCIGNIIGPLVFQERDAPHYSNGFVITWVTSLAAAGLAVIFRYICIWENRKRDMKGVEAFDHAYEDDLTDRT
ncbi:hypothetical protein VE04_07541, partial [Pseudogymnoascus sp. 24MN13]